MNSPSREGLSPAAGGLIKAKLVAQAPTSSCDQLYWTTDVVFHVINAYSAKMLR